MAVYSLAQMKPKIPETCFLAPSCDVIGKVTLGEHISLWFQVVARGDVDEIVIGENTNIQDLTMLHVSKGYPLHIGKNVTVGHHVVLHGCRIGDATLVGIGAKILDGAVIGENSLVAAGSVVPPGKTYPAHSLLMGAPAKVVRELSEDERKKYGNHYKRYLETKDEYKKALARSEDPSL